MSKNHVDQSELPRKIITRFFRKLKKSIKEIFLTVRATLLVWRNYDVLFSSLTN